jgi:hypothetical protein
MLEINGLRWIFEAEWQTVEGKNTKIFQAQPIITI